MWGLAKKKKNICRVFCRYIMKNTVFVKSSQKKKNLKKKQSCDPVLLKIWATRHVTERLRKKQAKYISDFLEIMLLKPMSELERVELNNFASIKKARWMLQAIFYVSFHFYRDKRDSVLTDFNLNPLIIFSFS